MKYALLILSFCVVLFASSAAQAAGECYKQLEAEAEQGIRIHSELMVIALNCQHIHTANGKNLYTSYREFTARNIDLFANYETVLIDYFTRRGDGAPIDTLNNMRTNFANKISNDAAVMRPDMFCKRYSPRILKASDMGAADLRKWASTIYDSHPVSRPLCERGDISVKFGDQ